MSSGSRQPEVSGISQCRAWCVRWCDPILFFPQPCVHSRAIRAAGAGAARIFWNIYFAAVTRVTNLVPPPLFLASELQIHTCFKKRFPPRCCVDHRILIIYLVRFSPPAPSAWTHAWSGGTRCSKRARRKKLPRLHTMRFCIGWLFRRE